MENNKPPVVKNFDRGVDVACWEKTGNEGKEYYSVTVARKYKDKNGEEHKETLHLFPEDLLAVAEIIRITYNDLMAYKYKKYKAQKKEQSNVTSEQYKQAKESGWNDPEPSNEPIDDEIPF